MRTKAFKKHGLVRGHYAVRSFNVSATPCLAHAKQARKSSSITNLNFKNVDKISTPNFFKDRRGSVPTAIVVHVTEGTFESAKSWIEKIESAVSYHIIVKENGELVRFVEDHETAWANGLIVGSVWKGLEPHKNPNLYTLSIAYAGTGAKGPTFQQVMALANQIKVWAKQWNIPLDDAHIIPHHAIRTDKTCPGKYCEVSALRFIAERLP